VKAHIRKAIRELPIGGLAKFKSAEGKRLHPELIKSEIVRRVRTNLRAQPEVVRHAAKQASRSIGKPRKR
jgi:hypothetical protein